MRYVDGGMAETRNGVWLEGANNAHAQLMTGYVGEHESSQDNMKACMKAVVEQRRNTSIRGSSEGHFYVPWVMIALP
jgi:hypothetical protein